MNKIINVTVWNEYRHEKNVEAVAKIYPKGMHAVIADCLNNCSEPFNASTATLDEQFHGLTDDVLEKTDVLIWWGHMYHDLVDDKIVEKVYNKVHEGMGLIVLHSGHFSKIFRKLMGTSGKLRWREYGEKERLWVVSPQHPIARGIDEYIEIQEEEMYGEWFDIPEPDELVFISWFEGGEVFRSGCCFKRGLGKIFYFRPGHEAYPVFYNKGVQKAIRNAVKWAANDEKISYGFGNNIKPLEKIEKKSGILNDDNIII